MTQLHGANGASRMKNMSKYVMQTNCKIICQFLKVHQMTEAEEFREFPPIALTNLPELRNRWAQAIERDAVTMLKAAEANITCEEIFIPLNNDGTVSRSLLYKPRRKTSGGSPLVVLIHGGGFILGSPDMEAPACIHAAETLGCICLSISYRLSPEAKFPTAHENCWEVLQWVRISKVNT